ncbi:MAG TPA: M1 family metallopeptidase [Nitrososphaeraceae archaeon]
MSTTVTNKKFEYPGSKRNFSPLYRFTINHMYLKIKPDFKKKQLLDCIQKLTIEALYNIEELVLDIAELDIHNVSSETDNIDIKSFDILYKKDKLVIKFRNMITNGSKFIIKINYSSGYYSKGKPNGKPRSGFTFIAQDYSSNSTDAIQSWTQGETVESRYWFPCIDNPQMKFAREIVVVAPTEEYDVISNGEYERKGNVWLWKESTPTPAYLTSVVIGKFNTDGFEKNIPPLKYYWPNDISKIDAMRTFADTPKIIKFFEIYLDTKYPYSKYWQVIVDKFEYGGMENTSCTTLTRNILHDERASLDYSRDIVIVAHELAHQWFGDLITCKDWSDIWLNEGFADYFESLYWGHRHTKKYEKKKTNDEFLYQIIQKIDTYMEEASTLYKRPIVTNLYKHPDELFDAHSYEKGGLVLHMLKNFIGEENFKKSIKKYINTYRERTAKTEDFQEICEKISGMDLNQFFYQWLFTAGHPELDIQIMEEKNKNTRMKKLKVKITQNQSGDFIFVFPLEIRLVYRTNTNEKSSIDKIERIQVNEKETKYTFKEEISANAIIDLISIDPELKILKEIRSLTIEKQNEKFNLLHILKNQLKDQTTTIAERISALKIIKENFYSQEILELLKDIVMKDSVFYAVSVEAANVIGSYHDIKDFNKDKESYEILKECLTNTIFFTLAPQTKRAIISNIGKFEREDTLELKNENNVPLLVALLDDQSYFVENATATTIGKSIKNLPDVNPLKEEMIKILKDKVNSITFQDQLAQGAINGLSELAQDENIEKIKDIVNLLINKSLERDSVTETMNRYFVRSAATLALGKFLVTKNEKIIDDKNLKERADTLNNKILTHLIQLLKDGEMRRIKRNACTALADSDAKIVQPNERVRKSIDALKKLAEEDVDGFVRRTAEVSLNVIREWLKEWTDTQPKLDINLRKDIDDKIDAKKIGKREKHTDPGNNDEKILKVSRKEVLEY